ncbi:8-amino-7-oxononanoate synthase [Camellia lanceoleosa]|uniref:8-amino-7-oxononanoate synthase n=1 Tax=Camellia lanceoleosa TaxID=1840588 RepID=A0ACC0FNP4_9ERIC|nr:8-amino-7-oxononanoate synthase [Camellia lanceoleosa]
MKNASNYDEFERWVREVLSCGTVNLIGFHFVFLCLIFLWVCFDLNKAALAHGMGPRGSTLICGYTSYHGLLESCLANLNKKEVLNVFYVLQSVVHWES